MLKNLLLLLAAATALSAADAWAKVRQLKPGSALHIYMTGRKQPLTASFDSLADTALIVILKNAQTSIPLDQVERVDARPPQSGSRASMETRRVVGSSDSASTGRVKDSPLPPRSTGGSVRIQPGADFQTVYKRGEK